MGHVAKADSASDAELVAASRRGERDAFGQLVTRYQDVVCAVSYSSTGNWALSEDVAQDTFIAAWRQLGQLRETGRVRAWLCQIARNLARKARQRTDREGREDAVEVETDLAANDGVDPFSATAQAEVDRVVREALTRIPDRYRETLVLYYCENQSMREVATTLGIAEDAAMQRLSRGRRYLADGVNALVERSLTSTRGRKDLRMAVLAALPHVDPPLAKPGSNMLIKIVLAAVVTAAVGTTAVVAVTRHDAAPKAAAATPTLAAAPTPVAKAAAPHVGSGPTMPPLPHRDGDRIGSNGIYVEDHPDVVDKATLTRLGIEQGPSHGAANAPVTIVVYQDLMCTYCSTMIGTIDQLLEEYPGKVRLVVKQFPVHDKARLAAEASLAADGQGKFWELHDLMMANQDDLSRDAIVGYAKQVPGMDWAKLADALDHHTYADALAKEVAAGKEVGIRATPEFLINGKDVTGARPIEAMRASIDEALAEATPAP